MARTVTSHWNASGRRARLILRAPAGSSHEEDAVIA